MSPQSYLFTWGPRRLRSSVRLFKFFFRENLMIEPLQIRGYESLHFYRQIETSYRLSLPLRESDRGVGVPRFPETRWKGRYKGITQLKRPKT